MTVTDPSETRSSRRPRRTRFVGSTRRRVVVVAAGVALVAAAILVGPGLYARFLAPEPPSALGLSTPAADAPEGDAVAGPVEDGAWQIGEGSEAGYRLDEVLSGQPVTVVGRTTEVSGELVVEDGMLVSGEVVVDVASIATDETARDGYFRRALDVQDVPEARFTLTEPVDLSALGADGSLAVDAVGTLTLHDVDRPATVTLEARRTADGGVEVAGSIPVVLTDHGLTAPDLGFVQVEPEGLVEMRLQLRR